LETQIPKTSDGSGGEDCKKIAGAAEAHYREGNRKSKTLTFAKVELGLVPASNPLGKAFVLGFESDGDSGGFLGDMYPVSIRLALLEKVAKTEIIAGNFVRWALVLVDDITPGMMLPHEIGPLDLNLGHFNSVVVINPDASLALEWPDHSLSICEPKCKVADDSNEEFTVYNMEHR
jgi:hypothetical protein